MTSRRSLSQQSLLIFYFFLLAFSSVQPLVLWSFCRCCMNAFEAMLLTFNYFWNGLRCVKPILISWHKMFLKFTTIYLLTFVTILLTCVVQLGWEPSWAAGADISMCSAHLACKAVVQWLASLHSSVLRSLSLSLSSVCQAVRNESSG